MYSLQKKKGYHMLLIAYFFPPAGGPGSQRFQKMIKYLSVGWEITVVARKQEDLGGVLDPIDDSLLDELQISGIHIIRVHFSSGEKNLAVVEECERQHYTNPFDVIVVTMSPFFLAWTARTLKEHLRVPLVIDLRDPWALDGCYTYGSRKKWRNDYKEMEFTIKSADGISVTTPELEHLIKQKFAIREGVSICSLTNGYDPEDFLEGACRRTCSEYIFSLVYVGSLTSRFEVRYRGVLGLLRRIKHYRPERVYLRGRTPLILLKALKNIKEQNPDLARNVHLTLVSGEEAETIDEISKLGIEEMVTITGYQSHRDAISYLKGADALFLSLHGLPKGQRSRIIPGKLFEYLASERPVLAAVPDGDAKDILMKAGNAIFADPLNACSIKKALINLHSKWMQGSLNGRPLSNFSRQYSRKVLAEQFSSFLIKVISDRS